MQNKPRRNTRLTLITANLALAVKAVAIALAIAKIATTSLQKKVQNEDSNEGKVSGMFSGL